MQKGKLGAVYEGSGKYCFITYQKEDTEAIRPIMKILQKKYRFWYDSGAVSGRDWPEVVARKIGNAGVFLIFLSKRTMSSGTVRREIHYAAGRDVTIICVYLEECEISAGLAMQTETATVIRRHLLKSDKDAANEIMKVLPQSVRRAPGERGEQIDLYDMMAAYRPVFFGTLCGFLAGCLVAGGLSSKPLQAVPFRALNRSAAEKESRRAYADLLEEMPERTQRYFFIADLNGDGVRDLAAGRLVQGREKTFQTEEIISMKPGKAGRKPFGPVLLLGRRDGIWYDGNQGISIDFGDLEKHPERYVRCQITEAAYVTAVDEIMPPEVTVYAAEDQNISCLREGRDPDREEGTRCSIPDA